MKAIAVYPAQRAVRLTEIEPPRLARDNEVQVRILDVGVCGTDKEICAFEYGTPPAGAEGLVIGHEALGVVEAVGRAVAGVAPGELVVPMVRRPCPHDHCASCRDECQDFCFTGDFAERGIKARHGFMTERIVDEARWMIPVPGHLREVGVLVEPLTIAEKALIQVRALQQRLPWTCPLGGGTCHGALVLGAGPVGLLGAMALRAEGFATKIYSRGLGEDRRRIVEQIGAELISAEQVAPSEVARAAGKVDLVYEAMGASQTSFEVLAELGTNGVFVFTGVPGRKAPVAIDTDRLMRNLVLKNQIVLGTVNAGRDAFAAAIVDLGRFVALWPEAVQGLITGRFVPEQHRELLLGKAGGIKNVISFAA